MSDQIPGSRPKKLIRRTNMSNPSLVSNSILTLFNPESLVGTQREQIPRSYSQMERHPSMSLPRNNSQKIFSYDSLYRAQDDYLKQKLATPYFQMRNPDTYKTIEPKQKQSHYSSAFGKSDLQFNKKFNYANFDAIKSKQKHGYDIISFLPKNRILA